MTPDEYEVLLMALFRLDCAITGTRVENLRVEDAEGGRRVMCAAIYPPAPIQQVVCTISE